MKRITALLTLITICLALLCSCSFFEQKTTLRIGYMAGPTGMGMAKLILDGEEKYTFTLTSNPTDVTSALISKSVDIAAVPTNLAATLYKRTEKGIKMIGINTLGSLYVLENGNTINSVADLRGKTK